MEKSIKVFVPASVSNVGPGFDLMGFAINGLGDEIIVRRNNQNKIRITKITGDDKKLPYDINRNTVTVGVIELLKNLNMEVGLDFEIHKKMGIGSGLGSSAASAVAGVYAAVKLLEIKINKKEMLPFAMIGEKVASGSIHADNVAPALLGGFCLISSYEPVNIQKIKTPSEMYCSIVYPNIEIKTLEARKMISKNISIKKSIAQAGRAASLILALGKCDYELMSDVLIDEIAEPKRAGLIPCFDRVRSLALLAGGINCNISGSGPAMFSFSNSKAKAFKIAEAMENGCWQNNIPSKIFVSKINNIGAKILE